MTTKEQALEALNHAKALSGYCYDAYSVTIEIRDWFAQNDCIIIAALEAMAKDNSGADLCTPNKEVLKALERIKLATPIGCDDFSTASFKDQVKWNNQFEKDITTIREALGGGEG